jgi:hypothetical protein
MNECVVIEVDVELIPQLIDGSRKIMTTACRSQQRKQQGYRRLIQIRRTNEFDHFVKKSWYIVFQWFVWGFTLVR